MDAIGRKGKDETRFRKRIIVTGIAAAFVFLVLIAFMIMSGMEGMNLTRKGNLQNIDPIILRITHIGVGTLLAVILMILLMRISTERNEADKRMRIMFDTTPLCANFWDKNFNNIDCNQEAVKLFELSSKKEYNDRFFELSPEYQPDGSLSKDKAIEYIKKAFEEGYLRFEWMHQKLNGEPIPCEVTLVRVNHNNEYALTAYLRDLRELKQRDHLLNMVNSVASLLLTIHDEKSFEVTLLKSFELVGRCLDIDRVQIWRNEMIEGELHFVLQYAWFSEYDQNSEQVPIGLHFSYSIKPEWESLFLRGGYINSPLSCLKEAELSFLHFYGMKSIVIIPMFLEGNFWGLFSIDDCRRERTFSDEEMHILTSVGLMMSSAVDRDIQMAKVREADERIRIMFDAMPLGAAYHDKNKNCLECNQNIVNIFGLSNKQEFIDKFYQLLPEYQPDGNLTSEKMAEVVDKAFADGYCRFKWMYQKLNGEPIPCEVTIVRVKHNNEFILTVYIRDLSELEATIKQVHESEQSLSILSNILNGIDALIYVTAPETGEILFINNQVKKSFNIKDDGIGQICYEVFQSAKNEMCDFCPCHKLDKEPDSILIWEEHNQITKRTYRNTDRYIEWQNGRIVHIQYSVDVTELIEAKELAERSNRSKNRFLSRVSHEIRTPMNAILGITEIQLENNTLSPETKEAFGGIYNSGYLLLGIINDILDLSKIEAGKLELTPSVYDVPSLINDTVHIYIMRYDSKQIKFDLKVDKNIPSKLYGDELRIKQILNNLLSNAYKYTDEGNILLSVAAEYAPQGAAKATLVFIVSDTGQGMTGEQLDKLFDEYTRFNAEANRTTQGTGLGMNITRHLINLMGGEISVESEPGKGSVFTVRLPQEIVDSEVLGSEVAENLRQFRVDRAEQMKKGPRIVREYMPYGKVLIVDDVETNLYVVKGLMAPYGLLIETAISGFEAVEKIKNGATFDIIFMDHYMPKMDGIETVKIIRSLGYTQPIVALTANALVGQAEMFMENGFDGFISKPIDIRQLNISLNKLIRDKYPPEVLEAARQQAAKITEIKTAALKEQSASGPELAALFVRDAEKAIAMISSTIANTFRRSNDVRQYTISVHSMKSALANIGENELSAVAFKLEQAGRVEDMAVIMSETPAFLESLRTVVEKNKPKKDDEKGDVTDWDKAYLGQKLADLQVACAAYDKNTAKAISVELKQKSWPHEVKELLNTISEYLLHSDFEEAAKVAKEFL
jgi:signal transduction histidine kinase/CheY-like chemotaxis protein